MSSYFNSLASRIRSRSSGRGTGVGSEESGSDSDSSSEESRNGERQDETLQLPSELAIQLDTIEVLGAYGWSSQLSCSYYHEDLSLIFAGTEEGSLYVHGRDQQWIKPARGENPNRIMSINGIPIEGDDSTGSRGRVLLVLADGSVELWEFNWDSITLIDAKSQAEIGCQKDEKLTSVLVDAAGGYPFVYLGTSKGGFQVIECTLSTGIRLCEYNLPRFSNDVSNMALMSMKICPKDERYIGLAYCNFETSKGLVVIYDMSKQKVSSQYSSLGLTLSLEWDHRGNVLFAGTESGEVFILKIKQKEESALKIWKYSGESSDLMHVLKLAWLAPQGKDIDEEEHTCLFALIGAAEKANMMDITNPQSCAIMALHFDSKSLALTDCLMFPPPPDENVTDFNIVSYGHSSAGLLMLSQRLNAAWTDSTSITLLRPDKYFRSLQLYPCPNSRTLDWELETGLLPDPIKVSNENGDKTLPAPKVTCLATVIPSPSDKSLGKAMIRSSAASADDKCEPYCIRLATTSDSKHNKGVGTRAYIRGDVVILGNSVGGISVFRVNPTNSGSSSGYYAGIHWSLLHQFQLGSNASPIKKVSVYEEDGIFMAFNEEGEIGIWSVSDTVSAPRLLSHYRRESDEIVTTIALARGSDNGNLKVFVGTTGGSLYFDSILDKKSRSGGLKRVKTKPVSKFRDRSREICSLHSSRMKVSGQMTSVIFVVYTSGVVEAISTSSGAPVSVAYGYIKQMADRKSSHALINAVCVTDSQMNVLCDGSSGGDEGDGHPTYLVATMSSALVYYHLDTFVFSNQVSEIGDAPSIPFATIKPVSNCRILDQSSILRFGGNNYVCLVDEIGVAALVTLERKHPTVCYQGLLDSIFKQQYPSVVRDASVCGNGDCFLLVGDVIFTVRVGNSAAALPIPSPASIDVNVPKPCEATETLSTGRKDFVAKRKKDIETRRTSMITMTFVTDLRRTFMNTRPSNTGIYEDEEGGKYDELVGDRLEGLSSATVQSANATNDAMANMAEARRNLELRGEKLEELQEKSEELARATSQYQSDATNNRRYLEKKKKSWSFF